MTVVDQQAEAAALGDVAVINDLQVEASTPASAAVSRVCAGWRSSYMRLR